MVNRRGQVSEQISTEDFQISIRGLMWGAGTWPEDQVSALRDLWERNEALTIENVLTDIFLVRPTTGGKDKVIIDTMPEIFSVQGKEDVVAYSLELVSDQELELIVS
jgi:hypothetical protein